MKRNPKITSLLALSSLLCGCGPVVSGVQIVNANIAISAAETAGARNSAVYEYISAQEYLHKAREEHGYSDFAASQSFAEKSLKQAQAARQKAEHKTQMDQAQTTP